MLQALSLKLVGHFRPNSCPSMTPHCLWPCYGGCLVVHHSTSRGPGPCGRSQRWQTIHQSELSSIKFWPQIREFELFERRRPDALGPSHMLLAHAPTWPCIYMHMRTHMNAFLRAWPIRMQCPYAYLRACTSADLCKFMLQCMSAKSSSGIGEREVWKSK